MSASYSPILHHAAEIADARESLYGDVRKNLTDTANLCHEMFQLDLTPEDIAKVLIAIKFARNKHTQKADNLLDAMNYTAVLLHLSSV